MFVHKMWNDQELCKMVEGGVPFAMLSDAGGKVGKVYGVYDEEAGVETRGRFLIDPDGIIQAYEVLTPQDHFRENVAREHLLLLLYAFSFFDLNYILFRNQHIEHLVLNAELLYAAFDARLNEALRYPSASEEYTIFSLSILELLQTKRPVLVLGLPVLPLHSGQRALLLLLSSRE